jgi:hypothetical protein
MTTDPFERAIENHRDRRRHRRRAAVRTLFRYHLAVFVAVQVLLVVVWLMAGAGYPWFIFPLLGWGIGLAAHAVAAYGDRGRGDGGA